MSNQFLVQLSKLKQLLAAPNTLAAYSQVLVVTYNILKESLVLAWLTICLVLVLFDWMSTRAISTGKRSKELLGNLKEVKSEEFASETGKSILSAGKAGLAYTISQAREQLGLSEKPSDPAVSVAEE
jgi:hypothetical protein